MNCHSYLYKVFCITCFVFAVMATSYSQSHTVDSLRRSIATAKTPQQKVVALCEYAGEIRGTKRDSAMLLARHALLLSKEIGFSEGIGIANNIMGACHYRKNNDSALYYFKQAVFYCGTPNGTLLWIGRTSNNLINAYLEFALYDSAIQAGKKTLSIINAKQGNGKEKTERLMYLNGTMGRTYYYTSNYDSSAVYFLKAIAAAEKLPNYFMLTSYYQGMGMLNAANKEFHKAIGWGEKSVEVCKKEKDSTYLILTYASIGGFYEKLNNFNLAKKYIDSSIALAYAFDSSEIRSMSYMVLGNIETNLKNYSKAMEHFQKGLLLENRKSGNMSSRLSFHRKLADLYLLMDSLPQAEKEYTQILQQSGADNQLKADGLIGLSEVHRRQGNYTQAYKALAEGKTLYDAVLNAEKTKIIQDLNIKYETENKEKKLLLLENEKLMQAREIESQNQELIAGALILKEREETIEITKLLADKQQQQMMIQTLSLTQNQNELKQQQLTLSNINRQLQVEQQEKALQQAYYSRQKSRLILGIVAVLGTAIIFALYYNRQKIKTKAASEQSLLQERLRISRELHDEVGATLSGVVMYTHFTKAQMQSANMEAVENSLNIMQQSSEDMVSKLNEIVWLVNPEKDSLQKLIQRLEEYARNMAAIKNIKVNFVVSSALPEQRLSFERRKNIYLICKEAINNAIKYSSGNHLSLAFQMQSDKLAVTISDNGKGFEVSKTHKGNGLLNMRKRAEEIGADFKIHSEYQQGTAVSLVCPIA